MTSSSRRQEPSTEYDWMVFGSDGVIRRMGVTPEKNRITDEGDPEDYEWDDVPKRGSGFYVEPEKQWAVRRLSST